MALTRINAVARYPVLKNNCPNNNSALLRGRHRGVSLAAYHATAATDCKLQRRGGVA